MPVGGPALDQRNVDRPKRACWWEIYDPRETGRWANSSEEMGRSFTGV